MTHEELKRQMGENEYGYITRKELVPFLDRTAKISGTLKRSQWGWMFTDAEIENVHIDHVHLNGVTRNYSLLEGMQLCATATVGMYEKCWAPPRERWERDGTPRESHFDIGLQCCCNLRTEAGISADQLLFELQAKKWAEAEKLIGTEGWLDAMGEKQSVKIMSIEGNFHEEIYALGPYKLKTGKWSKRTVYIHIEDFRHNT